MPELRLPAVMRSSHTFNLKGMTKASEQNFAFHNLEGKKISKRRLIK